MAARTWHRPQGATTAPGVPAAGMSAEELDGHDPAIDEEEACRSMGWGHTSCSSFTNPWSWNS